MLNVPGLNFEETMSLPGDVTSADVLAGLQRTFGAQKYDQQSVSRYVYYSYSAYPLAGATQLPLFANNQSQVGTAMTNIETANNLGNYSMLISSISFDVQLYLPTVGNNPPWSYLLDADCPYPDIVHGFTQAGISQFSVNNTIWDQVDRPFLYAPSSIGRPRVSLSMSGMSGSQSGMSPFAFTGSQTVLCYADVLRRAKRRRLLKNKIFLAPQTTFSMNVFYPSGAIPVIGTTMITNAATPPTGPAILYGCRIDGYRYAPTS